MTPFGRHGHAKAKRDHATRRTGSRFPQTSMHPPRFCFQLSRRLVESALNDCQPESRRPSGRPRARGSIHRAEPAPAARRRRAGGPGGRGAQGEGEAGRGNTGATGPSAAVPSESTLAGKPPVAPRSLRPRPERPRPCGRTSRARSRSPGPPNSSTCERGPRRRRQPRGGPRPHRRRGGRVRAVPGTGGRPHARPSPARARRTPNWCSSAKGPARKKTGRAWRSSAGPANS